MGNNLESHMKKNVHPEIHKKMIQQDKFYGATTMGARGQVVIPAEARKDLGLVAGDQMLVMGKFGKALGLMKADQLGEFVKIIVENLAGTGAEKHVKMNLEKIFGKNNKK